MEGQPNESTLGHDENVETTEFIDTDAILADTWGEMSDPTFNIAATPDVALPGWFKRPRLLANYTWTGSISVSFDPWSLFFNIPDVVEKRTHFHMWHGNLKLRVVVNGNPFLYGRSVIGYIPFYECNDSATRAMTNFPANSHPRVSYLSQTLSDWIDPSTTQVIEMELPFLHPKNWARFYNEDVLIEGNDISNMGKVFIDSIADLVNASTGTSDTVTVSIFGYFDNLEMAVPSALPSASWFLEGKTRRRANIQTGEIKEASEGKLVVSTVASNVANAAGYLTKVPVIGPFAMATEIGATAVSSIAKIFGFSSPLQLADEMPVSIKPYSNMAFTTVANTATKISVDPLNEVTIDPRVTGGSSDDDLVIAKIAEREGFLTNVPWSASITPVSNRSTLCRIGVTPSVYAVDHGIQQAREPLPCNFASYPFRVWRGSMKYRFEVVASQYHRGKVVIFYEPSLNAQAPLESTIELDYAQHKNIIVDLEELNGLELVVPWGTSRPFAEVGKTLGTKTDPYNYFPAFPGDPAVNIVGEARELNGFIEVRVVNQLTSVADPATDISINVYASCEDLQVGIPRKLFRDFRGYPAATPASWFLESKEVSKQLAKSEHKRCAILPELTPDDLSKVVIGENVVSFRSLLKRYYESFTVDASAASNYTRVGFPAYPQGNFWTNASQPSGLVTFSDGLHILNYLSPAFVGMRGGFRHILDQKLTSDVVPSVIVENGNLDLPDVLPEFTIPLATGGHIFKRETNSAVSVSIPYYSTNRFYLAGNDRFLFKKAFTYTDIADGDFAPFNLIPGAYYSSDVLASNTRNMFRLYTAAADDFSLIHFLAAPPMFAPNPV